MRGNRALGTLLQARHVVLDSHRDSGRLAVERPCDVGGET